MISKKITLIGDFSTGKTSLIKRFVDNTFSDKYLTTIGVKVSKKVINIEQNILQVLIWDIEGGTPSKPINKTYLRGMHGSIIVADITREDTIESIKNYIDIAIEISSDIPIVIAINKCDMLESSSVDEVVKKLKTIYNEYEVFSVSAKSGKNVEELFISIANKILNI